MPLISLQSKVICFLPSWALYYWGPSNDLSVFSINYLCNQAIPGYLDFSHSHFINPPLCRNIFSRDDSDSEALKTSKQTKLLWLHSSWTLDRFGILPKYTLKTATFLHHPYSFSRFSCLPTLRMPGVYFRNLIFTNRKEYNFYNLINSTNWGETRGNSEYKQTGKRESKH